MEHTFTFVDLAGFSALTQTHGDEAAADLVERFTAIVSEQLEQDAELVATVGDAVFLVSDGPHAALRMLGRLWERAHAEPDFPALRAGLHHGEAARRGSQFFGTAVNLAARVAAQAGVGQVLLTDRVASAARELGLPVRSIGAVSLKNLRDTVELYRVELDDAEVEHIDPICRMRVRPETARAHLQLDGKEYWFCSPDCPRSFVAEHS